MPVQNPLGSWRSRSTFVFALCLASLGLGNLWRFAYLLSQHGGGPFMLAYVVCLCLLAAPVLLAEVVLGRQARGAPLVVWAWAARDLGGRRVWQAFALLACVTAMLLAVLYTLVAGWGLLYAWHLQHGAFAAMSVQEAGLFLHTLLAQPARMLVWQSVFLLVALPVVVAGVRRGLGVFAWVAMPALVLLLWLLLPYALQAGDLQAAGALLFGRHSEDFTLESLLAAMGHALFTVCVGASVGVSFGGYAPQRLPLGRSVLAVVLFDAALAVLLAVIVLPLLLVDGLAPTQGPGLLFLGLAHAFGNSSGGDLHGALFFLLCTLLALGALVALCEPVVGALQQCAALSRARAAALVVAAIWCLAAVVAVSLRPESAMQGLLPLLDSLLVSWLLPLGALAIAVFVGWLLPEPLRREALQRESALFRAVWLLLLRYVAPLGIVVVWFRALASA